VSAITKNHFFLVNFRRSAHLHCYVVLLAAMAVVLYD